jgi:hypothetical protein
MGCLLALATSTHPAMLRALKNAKDAATETRLRAQNALKPAVERRAANRHATRSRARGGGKWKVRGPPLQAGPCAVGRKLGPRRVCAWEVVGDPRWAGKGWGSCHCVSSDTCSDASPVLSPPASIPPLATDRAAAARSLERRPAAPGAAAARRGRGRGRGRGGRSRRVPAHRGGLAAPRHCTRSVVVADDVAMLRRRTPGRVAMSTWFSAELAKPRVDRVLRRAGKTEG